MTNDAMDPAEVFRFCPKCGHELQVEDRGDRAVPVCQSASCGFLFWQNAKPCVVAIIQDDKGRVLLTRRGIEPDLGKLDLPGGFVDLGELPEETVVREVKEEVGVEAQVGSFVGAGLDRYRYQEINEYILTLGYLAEITSGAPAAADRREISDVVWLDRKTVKPYELAFETNAKLLAMV